MIPKPTKSKKPRKPIQRSKKKGTKTSARRKVRKATKNECDKLWSALVKRDGKCYFAGKLHKGQPHVCKNGLQAMHGIPRGYHGTRWNLQNGIPGCGAIHTYYTFHKEEWDNWLLNYWGPELYERMWEAALKIAKPDYEQILLNLKTEQQNRELSKVMSSYTPDLRMVTPEEMYKWLKGAGTLDKTDWTECGYAA